MRKRSWISRLRIFSITCLCVGGLVFYIGFVNRKPSTQFPFFSNLFSMEYVYESINSIDVDANAILFSVKKGDENKIIIHNIEEEDMSLIEKDGNISIRLHQKRRLRKQAIDIVVKDGQLETLDINVDAGKVNVQNLSMNTLFLNNKATSVQMNHVVVNKKAWLNANAGDYRLKDVISNQTDMKLNAGLIDFSGELKGKSNLSLMAGSVDLNIKGNQEDYNYYLDNKAGSIYINGEKVNGFTNSLSSQDHVKNNLLIDVTTGKIRIHFSK